MYLSPRASYQLGWLSAFLKIYINVLQQASDLDDTVEDKLLVGDRPKQSNDPDNKLPWNERLAKRTQEEMDEVKSFQTFQLLQVLNIPLLVDCR